MKLIGISGYKQGGKSSLAEYIAFTFCGTEIISFADALKTCVAMFFAVPDGEIYGQINWDKEDFKQKKHSCGLTYRELLQRVGTDWFRAVWPDVWVKSLAVTLEHECEADIVIIPDVRFPNEVKFIQDRGGKVLRLTRRPFTDDCHESETALDAAQEVTTQNPWCYCEKVHPCLIFDAVIDNREMTEEEKNEAALPIVKEWLK